MTDVNIEVMTITPEVAEEWLGHNSHNRPLRNVHVQRLADAIKRGEWQLTGDAIRWSDKGVLLDGQHRLWAIIEAGKAIESVVIEGLPEKVQLAIDTEFAKRRLSDILRLMGKPSAIELAAILNYRWRMDNDLLRTAQSPTNPQALALLKKHPGLADIIPDIHRMRGRFKFSNAMVGAVFYEFASIDSEDYEFFLEHLVSGEELKLNDPIGVLRRWMERQTVSANGSRASSLSTHAVIVKAWNAYRDGKLIDKLIWKATGMGAEPVPVAR